MRRSSRVILIAICLIMIPAFWLPLWKITLDAPQYPEGLRLYIWMNHLSGDVSIINGLNHYIGMAHINEDQFPELDYITDVMIGVIITGLLVALLGRRWIFALWYFLFLGIAAFGIYRFWHWEYVYGHNLDPKAAIIIPGQAYQPPLFGCQQLLNFNACSFPYYGGALIMAMGTVSFLILIFEYFFKKNKSS